MKQIATYTALFSIVIHIFFTSGYLIDYYVNTEAYQARCENKAFPEMKCNGKCLLAKKIAMARAEDSKDPAPIPFISSEYLTVLEQFEQAEKSIFVEFNQHLGFYSNLYCFNYHDSLLKPPIG